ncbi:MAG: phosphatase PAP2 family protein [Sediminibacterium sp.]|jgi:undecaprenyl-diphosphatase|nr:MAG: phosphatase PAP2 family protein [Sediminibacterium sp.]
MILDIWTSLEKADIALFELINGQWTMPYFDVMMPWMRTSEHWIPFYLALVGYVFYRWGWKAWKWLLAVAITIALTDQVSSFIFKPFIHRLRPCADPAMLTQVKLLIPACPSSFSFTSSHAANHFSLAIFIFMTLQPLFKKYTYLFFLWAGLISYAQIYVGVHYPLDVFAGTFIGLVMGYAGTKLYSKWLSISNKH